MVGTHDFTTKRQLPRRNPCQECRCQEISSNKKGKNVSNGADEIDDIFSKKKITDASEIDDIFNTKSIKGDTAEKEPALSKSAQKKGSKKQQSLKKRAAPPPVIDDAFGDSRGIKKRVNRTTEDGYPLYDVKDLNIGGGLDTPECPFDCQCWFLANLQKYSVINAVT
ncbi:hypothetical protein V8B55DRAFT_1465892 [Mucor lusitanicus]